MPAIVPGVAPGTLISVGGVAISFDAGIPACPAGHAPDTHAATELAPAVEFVPTGHDTHAADEFAPAVTEYVPAVQFAHALAPVTFEYVPTGQLVHTVDELAPATPEYFPARHVTQFVASHVVLVRSTP